MKLKEILKTILVIAILLAITMIGLEIPRGIYSRNDENLMKQVTVQKYNVDVVTEPMQLEQKIEALSSDDAILAEDKSKTFNINEKREIMNQIADEIDGLLKYEWKDYIEDILTDADTMSSVHVVDVLRVVDDKIYSFDIGILSFDNYYSDKRMSQPGIIVFDMETNNIFNLEIILGEVPLNPGYSDAIYEQTTSYSITTYDDDSFTTSSDTSSLLPQIKENATNDSYYDNLSAYYDMDITKDDMAYVSGYSIFVEPFSIDDVDSKALSTLYDYMYDYYSDLY